jgi:hypothetical protein
MKVVLPTQFSHNSADVAQLGERGSSNCAILSVEQLWHEK